MSQVNLLPPELKQAQTTRRKTILVALVGLIVLVGIGFIYFLQMLNLSSANDDLRAQQAVNADLQAQIDGLAEFAQLQAELENQRQLIDVVFANEVAWSGVLLDVSRMIPSPAFISTLQGKITVATGTGLAAAPAVGLPTELIGDISFQGTSEGIEPLAEWLTRLEQVEGWVNTWFTVAQEGEPGDNEYGFTSGVDLTIAAVTERGAGGQR